MSEPLDSEAPDAARLHKPLARLLRPLVRLMIRGGMTFPALCALLREVYVNVAEHEFALPDKVQTDSRVSLLTGIHRKEVSRLRGAGAPVSEMPAALSRASRILARWLGGPPFSDAEGNPLALKRNEAAGSFDALVATVTRDVRPRVILDEWIDRGLVALTEDGSVVLQQVGFVPQSGGEQHLYYFGRNAHDHLAAAVANVLSDKPPFFERAVHYGGLSESVARELEDRARMLASQALQRANMAANRAWETNEGGSWRWNFGVYIYAEDEGGPDDAPKADDDP